MEGPDGHYEYHQRGPFFDRVWVPGPAPSVASGVAQPSPAVPHVPHYHFFAGCFTYLFLSLFLIAAGAVVGFLAAAALVGFGISRGTPQSVEAMYVTIGSIVGIIIGQVVGITLGILVARKR